MIQTGQREHPFGKAEKLIVYFSINFLSAINNQAIYCDELQVGETQQLPENKLLLNVYYWEVYKHPLCTISKAYHSKKQK